MHRLLGSSIKRASKDIFEAELEAIYFLLGSSR
jgi:hypothetical protein